MYFVIDDNNADDWVFKIRFISTNLKDVKKEYELSKKYEIERNNCKWDYWETSCGLSVYKCKSL
jgi:hypothetical protein